MQDHWRTVVKQFILLGFHTPVLGSKALPLSRSNPLNDENFSIGKFESSGRVLSGPVFPSAPGASLPVRKRGNLRRRDSASGDQLMQLERSRSAACTILFRAFAIGSAFRYPAVCRGAVYPKNGFIPRRLRQKQSRAGLKVLITYFRICNYRRLAL